MIRLTERFGHERSALDAATNARSPSTSTPTWAAILDQIAAAGFDRVIGTSGTILSLGALAGRRQVSPRGACYRSRRVSAKQLHRLRASWWRSISSGG